MKELRLFPEPRKNDKKKDEFSLKETTDTVFKAGVGVAGIAVGLKLLKEL